MAIKGFKPKNFLTKDTMRKIKLQWNKMTTRKRNLITNEELQHIRDIAVKEGERDFYIKANKMLNKRSSLTGWDLRRANAEQIKTLDIKSASFEPERQKKKEEGRIRRKLRKIERLTGINIPENKLMQYNIPSENILKITEDEYVEQRKLVNDLGPKKYRKSDKTIERVAKKDYQTALKRAKDISIDQIEQDSLDATYSFLGAYFKNASNHQDRLLIEEYVKRLSVQQRYNLMDTLASEKFRKEYDSGDDDENDPDIDATRSNRANDRQKQILQILRNETGLIIKNDEDGNVKSVRKTKKINKSNTFSNYL